MSDVIKLPRKPKGTPAQNLAQNSANDEVAELRAMIAGLQRQLNSLQIAGEGYASGAPPGQSGRPGRSDNSRVEDFAETMDGWFWETNAEDRFIYLSPNVKTIAGVTAEWHHGKRREDLGCPSSLSEEEWRVHLAGIARQEPFKDFVFQRAGPDGSRWIRTSGNPVFDADGRFVGYRGSASDITAQVSAETQASELQSVISEKNDIFETALQTIPDGVQVLNRHLELVAWNDQLFQVMDLDKDAILAAPSPGKALRIALARRGEYGPGDIDEIVANREAIMRARVPVHFERQQISGRWIECRGNAIHGGSYISVFRDISESRKLHEKLSQQASTDFLTGIANRRSFLDDANWEFERARQGQRQLAFLLLDIDHFKKVNDTFGHAVGDRALCAVVKTCKKVLRTSDRFARFGGEEFVVMLLDTTKQGAAIAAERLRDAIDQASIATDAGTFRVTVSIGVATMRDTHASPQEVITQADNALYEAKRSGRNRVVCR